MTHVCLTRDVRHFVLVYPFYYYLRQIVTGDETWVHHWDPESKVESMQWRHASSRPPRKFRTLPYAGKFKVTIFGTVKDYCWLTMYKPTSQDYNEWTDAHDNAPVPKSMIAQKAVRDCGFAQLDHPAYSPDYSMHPVTIFCSPIWSLTFTWEWLEILKFNSLETFSTHFPT